MVIEGYRWWWWSLLHVGISAGKSTILERLCMMPLFPRRHGLCTSVPIKINIRRAPAQRPTTLEVWDTATNQQIGRTRVIPLDTGEVDIRAAMAEAVRAQNAAVSVDRELRVCITSPTLPPMNMVDLPGTVEFGEEKERTHGLVRRYIAQHEDSSMFIVVVRADSSPTKCGVFQHIREHRAEGRTIGCFTFCDKMDSDDQYDMLRGWLSNAPGVPDGIPLEPYGYVATMNKPVRGGAADESNHARLLRQAQKEPAWFREEGFDAEVRQGTATTLALVNKLGAMYTEYVLKTFLPTTVGRLGQELLRHRLRRGAIGSVPSPGNLAPGDSGLAALREAATAAARRLIAPCFEAAAAEYAARTLAGLQGALADAIPETVTVGVRGVDAALAEIQRGVVAACANAVAEVGDGWTGRCAAALADDAAPFRLQRFPRFVARLSAFCAEQAPHVAEGAVRSVERLVGAVLKWDSPSVELEHDFEAVPATVAVRVLGRSRAIGMILNIFATGFVVPATGLDAMLAAVVGEVFADAGQERETGHAERVWLGQREADITRAARRLLQLADPALPVESGEPLRDTVKRVLPDMPDAALAVDVRRCVVEGVGVGSETAVVAGTPTTFTVTSHCTDGGRIATGGLPFAAVVRPRRAAPGAAPQTTAAEIVDNGDGTYRGQYSVDRGLADAAAAAEGLELSESVPFLCEISLYGAAVPGSPFAIAIRRGEPVDVTFTTLGTEGHTGPLTIGAHYDGTQLEGKVTLIEGYQRWEVPHTGRYRIEAHGAASHPQGYSEGRSDWFRHVGNGAVMCGEFQLRAGQSLLLLVGQRPVNPSNSFCGGGGGTFVTIGADRRTAEPILIAGGGGSWRTDSSERGDPSLCHATTERTGVDGGFGSPGAGGGAGSRNGNSNRSGSGGAGLLGSVTDRINDMTSAAQSFRDGGAGGTFNCQGYGDCNGGFGGGGCGGFGGSGGGGGYSGGSPGNSTSVMSAGGGGSFNTGDNQANQSGGAAGRTAGPGTVVIRSI